MVEKCPQYGTLASTGLQCNACYKHVHSAPYSLSPTSPAPTTLPPSPGMGFMSANNAPKFGTVIPSRIFVGGIDFKTSEEDLQKFFSAFGAVRDTKIIRDRAEVSKGYGFVTFSSTEEVNKVMDQEECLYLNGKKLNIGPAIRKQQIYLPKDIHVPGPVCSWVVHPGGYASYTNANGITYFLPTPQLMSTQMLPTQQPYVMAYNGAAAQPMAQYAGFSQAPGALQPIHGNMALPWSPTQAGSCGQILTPMPTLDHNQQTISMVPLASTNPNSTSAPASRTPVPPMNANVATVPQTHSQVPTTYVCSPMPGQQPVPMRFAPNSAQQVFHASAEQSQPFMHSINYCQQMCNTPIVSSRNHGQMASDGMEAGIALADANMMSAYGMQTAVYPGPGMMGVADMSGPVQYAPLVPHQAIHAPTPPLTPESQGQLK